MGQLGLNKNVLEAVDRLLGQGRPSDSQLFLHMAKQRGPLAWRELALFALKLRTSPISRPLHLLEFLAALAERLTPTSIIDPYVTSPLPLAAVSEATPTVTAEAVTPDQGIVDVGQVMSASVRWRAGDLLLASEGLGDHRYDLVLVAPPLGVGLPRSQMTVHGVPEGSDLAAAVLWRSRELLSPRGRLIFHTTDNFFTKRGVALREACTAAGLHLTAVVSVEAGFGPMTSTPSSLALFESARADQLFVGRLDRRTPVPELLDNLLSRRPNAANPHLGALTSSYDYRGWGPFAVQRELADAFATEQLLSIGELGAIGGLTLKAGRPYEAPPNAVFIPAIGVGDVRTSLTEYEGKDQYRIIELQLDPAKARAEYIAALLSSPVGKRLRESVSAGTTVPHVDLDLLATIQIPLPPVSAQDRAITTASHLASMEAAIARLRSELWRHPQQALRVIEQLERAAMADPIRRWLEVLPYPLASVLQRYAAMRDAEARVSSLLNFFEATAQFSCAVMLSVFRADPELLHQVRPDVVKAAPRRRKLFDRADFGLWLGLGQTLAQHVRRLSDDPVEQPAVREAAGPCEVLVDHLSDESFWALLGRAKDVRNQRAHGGVVSREQLDSWLVSLESLLGELEQALGAAFDEIDLVLVEEGRYKHGVHTYRRAQRLRGANALFEEFELQTREPIESGQLTFVSRDAIISPVLRVAPLFRVGSPSGRARNACYFFESHRSGAVSYVSYHFEDQPQIEIQDADFEQFVRDITSEPPAS